GRAGAQRPVPPLGERSAALVALSLHDTTRRRRLTPPPGRGSLALDGLPPAVGPAVLWGLRDCLAGAGRLARSGLSAPHAAGPPRAGAGPQARAGPGGGGMPAGPLALRGAGAEACPAVPPPLGPLHALPAAAKPLSAADRQAPPGRTPHVRGVGP